MQPCAMWWLVKISPSGETNDEDPFGARADDSRTWSSHSCDVSNPYFAFTLSLGNALNSHIPSSAKAKLTNAKERSSRSSAVHRFVIRAPWELRREVLDTPVGMAAPQDANLSI